MKKLILGILAVLLVTGCTASAPQENAVYDFNGETVSADAYYDKLIELYGFAYVYRLIENLLVADQALTETQVAEVKTQYDSVMAYYADEESQAYLASIVNAEGYTGGVDDLMLYMENGVRKQNVIGDYIDNNFTDLSLLGDPSPKMVMHVLVQFDDSGAFTSETQLIIEEVESLLATSDPADMEETLSDLIIGGYIVFENLGYTDMNTAFEEPFLNAALALNKGDLSGWVETSYGYHRIYVYGDTLEDFKGDKSFHSAVTTLDSTYENRAMWQLFSENLEMSDSLAQQVKEHLGIED